MSDQRNGGIAWTEQTWNPLRGCSRVSAGCVNCYAEAVAARFCGPGQPYEGTINPETKRWNGKIRLVLEKLSEPLRWTRPRRVFVNSMSDLFHPDVPDAFIDQLFAVMALAPQHTFQVLTKRPERMLAYMASLEDDYRRILDAAEPFLAKGGREDLIAFWTEYGRHEADFKVWPLPHIWLGVTVENQEAADERIPLLLQTPAAVRWVSAEPLLGPVDLTRIRNSADDFHASAFGGQHDGNYYEFDNGIDWVVAGGESGPHARPMHPDWARGLRDQCAAAGVPFLFKQWGEWAPDCLCLNIQPHQTVKRPEPGKPGVMFHCGKKAAGRLLDGVLHDGYPEVNV